MHGAQERPACFFFSLDGHTRFSPFFDIFRDFRGIDVQGHGQFAVQQFLGDLDYVPLVAGHGFAASLAGNGLAGDLLDHSAQLQAVAGFENLLVGFGLLLVVGMGLAGDVRPGQDEALGLLFGHDLSHQNLVAVHRDVDGGIILKAGCQGVVQSVAAGEIHAGYVVYAAHAYGSIEYKSSFFKQIHTFLNG